MQDIIDNCLIRLSPIDWLDVNKSLREKALGWIQYKNISCVNGVYYRIVRLLGVSNKYKLLQEFTRACFDKTYFDIRIWRLLNEYAKLTACELYRYIKYHDVEAAKNMIDTFKTHFVLDDIKYIRNYISDSQYYELKNHYDNQKHIQAPIIRGKIWELPNGSIVYDLRK